VDEARARRVAQNQAFFREVNENIEDVAETHLPYQDPTHFVCECGHIECNNTIPLPLETYEGVRAHPARFVVLPGHEIPGAEEVVDRHRGYFVVEKIGSGKQNAIRADPRS
jgi:hypothetical protein